LVYWSGRVGAPFILGMRLIGREMDGGGGAAFLRERRPIVAGVVLSWGRMETRREFDTAGRDEEWSFCSRESRSTVVTRLFEYVATLDARGTARDDRRGTEELDQGRGYTWRWDGS
jgi:hypothetical protein